ncbi:MAG: Rid family detoxifying hydrolase [Clostridiales Family XIII bacterium]|nr:Rid family detoxifying hydrolase [Clostridiales Family XIII bacterium]
MRRIVNADAAPAAIGPYSHANVIGELVFTSGQLGLDPATGKLADGIEAQTDQALKNLAAVLEASGSSLDRVLKATVFLCDMGAFAAANAVYARYFSGGSLPSRSAVEVSGLPMGALIEIEVVAAV